MKNTFGNSIAVTLFGESHGEAIGAVIDGLAPGIKIDKDYISARLDERKPKGKISTARREGDEFEIVSGAFNGYTTGTPLAILIRNTSTKSSDYAQLKDTPRPSHADYTAEIKYRGYQDYRGGGHFSGRITAALVAAGAIIRYALEAKGIKIGTHVLRLHGITDRAFMNLDEDIAALNGVSFPVLDDGAKADMMKIAEDAAERGDSVGGVLESVIIGVPAGVGEPWFDTLEGVLAHALFSVPAVKGVEFGLGFGFADAYGSEANDEFVIKDGAIKTTTNNNGGINGGISNGMPITFRTAIKPTPSIFKKQSTVNMKEMTECELEISGRHDPAIIHRARAVVDAIAAITIADMLALKYGTDWLGESN
ncbi:MAG: chorismate synthase [Clostridia bacterium]|nr:chorismate synthase [Clostridia bacterium]